MASAQVVVKVKALIKRGWHVTVTRLINLWPSVRNSYPPSSVNDPFHGYSKLQLHGTEESRNRRRSNDGDQTGDPPAQKAAHQPTELRLLFCRNVSHKQQSYSGLQSFKWSFSIKVNVSPGFKPFSYHGLRHPNNLGKLTKDSLFFSAQNYNFE